MGERRRDGISGEAGFEEEEEEEREEERERERELNRLLFDEEGMDFPVLDPDTVALLLTNDCFNDASIDRDRDKDRDRDRDTDTDTDRDRDGDGDGDGSGDGGSISFENYGQMLAFEFNRKDYENDRNIDIDVDRDRDRDGESEIDKLIDIFRQDLSLIPSVEEEEQ